ncbi:CRISPR system precrRNA processing endoribonuclease RAMP protein Cas6 [Shimazuella sp. AN120528]|uniref:CRISPR system precrRNA processing endoribonuclease RAMP protein Cas6 n=1 Tax=Shimazuella soli TaxID=1892854 RepID=UPI001F107146|nr:CRISPR system precrRNA processing endoribonuclease RAMP protein Cas6 [Shimazuella soli]MCH5584618.1 CRISPR system precrRNA processing endoribonuclease RAMP protein Cas6 [Shimazuella soli]
MKRDTMYTLTLTLKLLRKKEITGVHYRRLHAFVLGLIKLSDPALSKEIHGRKDRQIFSISYEKEKIRIYTPSKRIISCLQQALLDRHQVDLFDWQAKILQVAANFTTPEEIQNKFCEKFILRFITPTTFYQYGNYYPLPELNRLLSSASKVMEIVEGVEIDKHQLETMVRMIRIESANIKTERVSFGKFNIIGFCGDITLQCKVFPKEDQYVVWKLVNYGAMMGFGYKTAWGLGRANLISTSSASVSFL